MLTHDIIAQTLSPAINGIITTSVVGILCWSFTKSVHTLEDLSYRSLLSYVEHCQSDYCFTFLQLKDYQIATIVPACVSFAVFLFTMVMHLWWNCNLKKIRKQLFKDQPEYVAVPQVEADEDDEENRPGSPPSVVYGSHRGEHQFVLDFPSRDSHEEHEPVLLAIEPLYCLIIIEIVVCD